MKVEGGRGRKGIALEMRGREKFSPRDWRGDKPT